MAKEKNYQEFIDRVAALRGTVAGRLSSDLIGNPQLADALLKQIDELYDASVAADEFLIVLFLRHRMISSERVVTPAPGCRARSGPPSPPGSGAGPPTRSGRGRRACRATGPIRFWGSLSRSPGSGAARPWAGSRSARRTCRP